VLLLFAAGQAQAVPAPAIVSEVDCFSIGTYEEWMARLRAKNGFIKSLLIRWKFPEDEFNRYRRSLDCRAITYLSDGHRVHGWLVRPKNAGPAGGLPVIVYNRGGNRGYGALTFAHLFTHVFPLAESGYLVAASQYRGMDSAQDAATSPDQFGGDDVEDVTNLLRIVSGLPGVDPGNIFMVGQSRGAIMTFRALLESPVPVRAVAIYSGVYHLYDLLEMRPAFEQLFEVLIPDYRKQRTLELDKRSVTRRAGRLPRRTGILLLHGDEDDRAPLRSARTFAARLERLGHPHELTVHAGESHLLGGVHHEAHEQTLWWFERFRKPPRRAHGNH
jgi:dipeptidyl aminopeptidase/acylaminoacyl peptidase